MSQRCAIYARFSTDKQDATSIDDQCRKCREFAQRQDWKVLDEHIYADEAMSGVGLDRPAFQRMMRAALSPARPFDVVLVDDTSRLSRNQADAMRTFEQLNFAGVRVIAISQGIDSHDEQAELLVTVHGLMDSFYIKELAKKTHRGLEGCALRGLHTGGRCFGYRNVESDDGVRLEIDEREAQIVRQIFRMAASGDSLRTIARALNGERISAPRPRAKKERATWCPTAIREMLRRELYRGEIVWNRRKWVKVPGTNKRVWRSRPPEQWKRIGAPHLRIIDEQLWNSVQDHLQHVKQLYGNQHRPGLFNGAVTSRYLLTGLLKCATCGANLVIVTGRSGKGQYAKYGCPQNFQRGACTNRVRVRYDALETQLLRGLQGAVLRPETVEYAIEKFGRELRAEMARLARGVGEIKHRAGELEAEIERLTSAVASTGHSTALLAALSERETELRAIRQRALSASPITVDARLEEVRGFVATRLLDIRSLLSTDVPRARAELAKHLGHVRMTPYGEGRSGYYVAEGAWNLLGDAPETGRAPWLLDQRARMVAGVCMFPNAPAC